MLKRPYKKITRPFGHYREISDLGLDVYIKASVLDFPVMTSLSVNKWYFNDTENRNMAYWILWFFLEDLEMSLK